jgi:CubicO group peptidase (beta-lactamase class C family)
MRSWIRSAVCQITPWAALALSCGGSPAHHPKAVGESTVDEARPAPRQRRERRLDPSISVDNVERRLTPFIESIGAGFGPGSRPSGFVSVSAGGDVIYERGFGKRDLAADEENEDDTLFRVGAITAQFTAAAVLRLAQAHELSLSDEVGKFIPDYPAPGSAITIHQLLSHTSGLPNYLAKPELILHRKDKFTPRQLIELFWADPLEFSPGSDFGYSDSDYLLLGAIIERVTQRSYAEYMRSELFEPFDLDDTSVGSSDSTEDLARGYSASPSGGLDLVQGFDDSILYAAAGARSTAHDLSKWNDALEEGQVFDGKHEELAVKIVKNHYAYGWFVRDQRGHTVISHPGALEGFVSELLRVPDLDLCVVVLLNNSSADAASIADAAFGIALGDEIEPRPRETSVTLDPSVPPRITGIYRLSDADAKRLEGLKIPKRALLAMRSIRIYREGDKLFFKPAGQAAVSMVATGRSSFLLVGGKAKIEVPLDPGDAPATRVLLEQGPLRAEFTRRARQRGKPEEPEDADADGEAESEP